MHEGEVQGAWLVDIIITWNAGTDAQRQGKPMQLVMCVVNMLVVLGFSMVPYIDWAAHAFGMLGGLLVGFITLFCRLSLDFFILS